MGWNQVKAFNPSKMGTTPGMCLANTRKGYGIGPKYASAKDDMLANKKAGKLHTGLNTIPSGRQVPLYWDTKSQYEHINVSCGDGKNMWNDGKKVALWRNTPFFGWGETCNGVTIVSWSNNTPVKKSNDEIAKEVLAGKWGNGDDRKRRLQAAGYDYNAIQAIVNQKAKGGSSSGGVVYHIVKRGETLSSIAKKYGTTYQKIAQLSGIKDVNRIYVNQRLRVR